MIDWLKNKKTEEEVEEEDSEAKVNIPVFIDEILLREMNYLSNLSYEVSGWIVGEKKPDGIFLKELLFPTQTVSTGETEIKANHIAELKKEYGKKVNKIIFHHHTHAGLGCFWSQTDEQEIEEIMRPRDFFGFIVSSRGKHLIRLELRKPFKISVSGLKYSLAGKESDKVKEKLDKEIEKKVTQQAYTYPTTTNSVYDTKQNNLTGYNSIGSGVSSSYDNKTLTISDMPESLAQKVYAEFKNLKTTMAESVFSNLYDVTIEKIKPKKAKKIIKRVTEIVEQFQKNLNLNKEEKSYFGY